VCRRQCSCMDCCEQPPPRMGAIQIRLVSGSRRVERGHASGSPTLECADGVWDTMAARSSAESRRSLRLAAGQRPARKGVRLQCRTRRAQGCYWRVLMPARAWELAPGSTFDIRHADRDWVMQLRPEAGLSFLQVAWRRTGEEGSDDWRKNRVLPIVFVWIPQAKSNWRER